MRSARYFAPVILIASAVYALVAVAAFVLVLGPVGYEYNRHLDAAAWVLATLSAVMVVVPYAILYAAHRCAADSVSLLTTAIVTAAAAALAGFVYFFSFRPNDGEYIIAYVVVPVIQAPFALAALMLSLWRRKRNPRAA